MKTFAQLKTEIRNQIWVGMEGENLMEPHDHAFQEGAADIAKWVRCEQVGNVDLIEFCKTFYKCGMTIVDKPAHSLIARVFTVSNKNFCDPVFYRQVEWPEVECAGRSALPYVGKGTEAPLGFGTAAKIYPLGFSAADHVHDSRCGRARTGVWAIHRGNIYIAPWIQSTEMVVIEWDGIKLKYGEDDPINEAQDYKAALKLFMQYAHERDYGDLGRAAAFHTPANRGLFDEALGDLAWQCEQENKLRETAERCLIPHVLEETGVAEEEESTVLAHIGEFASNDSNEELVAQLVDSFGSSAVIGTAPNVAADYDLEVGQYYERWLKPYHGVFGEGAADRNRFWPCPGEDEGA